MIPAEHYAEAERLERAAAEVYNSRGELLAEAMRVGMTPPEGALAYVALPNYLLARALVHATLALAPAGGYPHPEDP